MANTGYDSLVLFDREITFKDTKDNTIKIYGLLFNKDRANRNDLFTWSLNRFICYTMACEAIEYRGGKVEKEIWTSEIGEQSLIIIMTNNIKNFIYRTLKNDIIPFRIIEYDKELQIVDGETVDSFLVSKNPLIRLGVMNGKEEKPDSKKIAAQQILLQKIQTLSEFNEMDEGDSDDLIEIASNQGQKPTELSITEKEKRALKGMLLLEDFNNVPDNKENTRYVKTYDEFLKEEFQKRPPQDPDYDDRPEGWRDDLEEEEE